jgi:hypothetical protein
MALLICVMTLLCGCIFGQSITGTLTGTIVDSSNAAVPGATVEAKNLTTGFVRNTVTGPEGIFVFNSLEPARYNLTVKATGFKALESNNLDVTASAPLNLGRMTLALGAITEEIAVTAAATPVQTASSENSRLMDTDQIVDLTLKGRDLFASLVTVPGVYFGNTYLTGGDATSESNALQTMSINGGGEARVNVQVDGIADLDTGSNGTTHFEPTMDAISEIRVLTTNYQAEYGRNSSGTVSIITKGGSQEFHGTAYVNKRHEMFNAKTFFNNEQNVNKSIYRFFVWGYSVGGPVYIPKHWNTQKKRLFFFFSQEYTKQKPATETGITMVPTPAQLTGNMYDRCVSGSSPCVPGYVNGNGTNEDSTLVDPSNNKAALAGGNLNSLKGTSFYDPTSAAYGQAMLAFLPPPNMCVPASGILNGAAITASNCNFSGQAAGVQIPGDAYTQNYFYSFPASHPRRNDTVRFDLNLTSKLTTWARYINDYDLQNDCSNCIQQYDPSTKQWVNSYYEHPNPGHGYGVGITYTISPTMVNEFTFGKSYNTWSYYPNDPATLARANMNNPPSFDNFATDPNFVNDTSGVRPLLTPGPQNFAVMVPGLSFGGGSEPNESGGTFCGGGGIGDCPYTNWNNIYSFNDALSKVQGKHNLKAGIYIEHTEKVQHAGQSNYTGNYNFSSGGAAMSADTQDGFANGYLGNFNTYNEGPRDIGDWWFWDVEAFIQDNWRVSRRLTLDLGVRFYHTGSIANVNTGVNGEAAFVRSSYVAAAAERIYYPGCAVSTAVSTCSAANQYAIDPTTGYKTFYNLQGTLVPASVGGYSTTPTPAPGMVIGGTSGLPLGLYTPPYLSPAPRIGFAWDVFGNGRTAVRGGVGIFINRGDFNTISGATGQAPITYSQSVYFANINSINTNAAAYKANAAIGVQSPGSDFVGNQPNESDYNGSFMIQQNLGFSTVLDASWVFNLRRHVPATTPINYQPLNSQYATSWASPMAQYLLNPAKNGGLTQGNESGLDLSANYFYGPSLCGGCVFGLGGINAENFDMSSDTHSLQINLRRNLTRHLSYTFAYNFSKTMNTFGNGGNGNVGGHDALFPDKFRNWGATFLPAPQTISVSYVYEAPNLGQKLNFKPLGFITDHWTWSGITQWRSDAMTGIPGISFANTNSTSDPQENWTGSSDGARMFVTGNYRLSSIGQSPQHNGLGANAVSTPSAALGTGSQEVAGGVSASYTTAQYNASPNTPNGSPGAQLINEQFMTIPFPCSATAAANPIYGIGESMECYGNAGGGSPLNIPGTRVLNFDMTFAKNFPLKSEKRVLIFRAEMYNIFNHPDFSGWNIGPGYDWNNWKNGVLVQTSNNLGRYTGTLNPRQMSMSLRLQF